VEKRFDVRYNRHQLSAVSEIGSATLGSLCLYEPNYGASARAIERTEKIQPKYIRITDFTDNGIEDGHTFASVSEYLPKHILNDGDILFARSGATVGKTYRHNSALGLSVFAGYCIRFAVDPAKAVPEYVYWYTKTKKYADWVQKLQRPSAQPNINKEEYKSLEVILPSRNDQLHFVSEMNVAFQRRAAKIREADALLAGMDEYVCSTLGVTLPTFTPRLGVAVTMAQVKADKAFNVEYYNAERTTIIDAIKTVPHKRLGDCADFMRDLVSATSGWYLGLAGVQSNTGELSGADDEANGQAFSFSENNVLYCRLRPYLNKAWKAERGGVCSTEFHVIRMKSDDVLPDYLAAVMRSQLILRQTRHMMTGNTHPRIGNEDVANLMIPVPNKDIQSKVTTEMQARQNTTRVLRSEAEAEWTAAKARFERELLATGGKHK
jgi:hypothetical protein